MILQPLKILMTDPHLRGGGQVRYVGNLARELTAMGHDVTIGCKPGSVLVDRAREAGCGVADRFAFRSGLRREWRQDIVEARRCLLYDMPDIVHVSGSQDHWLFGGVNRLLGYATCLVRTRHNTYAVKSGLPNRILNRRWTDFQIVVCQTVCDDLARHPAFDAQRLFPIHNGVDAELFKPDADARQKIRAEFGYGENHVVCGIVARLVPAKGHDFLFQAVAQLKVVILTDEQKTKAKDIAEKVAPRVRALKVEDNQPLLNLLMQEMFNGVLSPQQQRDVQALFAKDQDKKDAPKKKKK